MMVPISPSLPSLLQLSYLELMLSETHTQGADRDQLTSAPQLDFLAHKPQEVAQQLTLLQFAFYTAIDRREMLNAAWKGKHRARNAPNILRAIEQGNKVCVCVRVRVCACVCVLVCMHRCGLFVHVIYKTNKYILHMWSGSFISLNGYNPADCDVGVYRGNPATHRA